MIKRLNMNLMHVRVNDVSREVDAEADADNQDGASHGVDF